MPESYVVLGWNNVRSSLLTQAYFWLSLVSAEKIRSANWSHETISVTSGLIDQSHFTLHIRISNTKKSRAELSKTRVKKWRTMCSGKFAKFSGLIGLISIKRKPCDLFLNFGPFWFQKVDLFLWRGGQQSACETWCHSSESILKQAIWLAPFVLVHSQLAHTKPNREPASQANVLQE